MVIKYPLGVLDYESSGLDDKTYPIEIGIAIRHHKHEPIMSWSSLIQPTQDWNDNGYWNPSCETIHHISQAKLKKAPKAISVALEANKFAKNITLYYDGGIYDRYWHIRFAKYAPELDLNILPADSIINMTEYLQLMKREVVQHRAGPDAIQNLKMIETVGIQF